MRFEQGHILGRPSVIYVEVEGVAGKPSGVRVGGRAVTVLEGTLVF
jgi:predicted PhzF superfamily epimerase YddE/YHI9